MNYDDIDCQKKIICEFMDQPEMFGKLFSYLIYGGFLILKKKIIGKGGTKVKSGVQWAASWLKPLGFTVVDQISEAATLEKEVRRNGIL